MREATSLSVATTESGSEAGGKGSVPEIGKKKVFFSSAGYFDVAAT